MRFIDFFSGIGGFRMAMERAGHECVGFCEIDRHAAKSYRAIYDTEGEYYAKDITRIDPADLPDFDCLTGGFPCQSFSIAGKRGGFDDTRGTLFFDITRIAEARRPDVLLLENVKGLLSHDGGRTFRVILRTLDELGYDCEWQVLNSKDFGVPQNRERVFIVGHLRGRGGRQVFPLGGTGQTADIERVGTFPSNRNDGLDHASDRVYDPGGLAPTVQQRDYKGAAMITVPQQFSDGTGLAHAIDANYHKGIGPSSIGSGRRTHVVKQIMEADYDRDNPSAYRVYDTNGLALTIDTAQGGGRQPHVLCVNQYDETGKQRPQQDRAYHPDGIMTAVCSELSGRHNVVQPDLEYIGGIGDPNRLDDGKALSRNYKQGSRVYGDKGVASSLSAAGVGGPGGHTGLYRTGHRIRRLTPRECWRLQGFPDWAFDKAKESGVSDTQLYRQAGNSVTVNVVYEIAKRLTNPHD